MKKFALLLAMGVGVLSLTGCGKAQWVAVYTCNQYQKLPTDFTPYCADAGQNFTKLKWTYWGTEFANGTGKALTNLCDPNCAAGREDVTDVDLTMDKPKQISGHLVFTELVVKYHEDVAGHPMIEKVALPTAPLK